MSGTAAGVSRVHVDPSSNFHPFECDGPGKCVHCDRLVTYIGVGRVYRHQLDTLDSATWKVDHDPATCALCDPEYDHGPALAASGQTGETE